MTDKELLEVVAKLIGLTGAYKEERRPEEGVELIGIRTGSWTVWNPLRDDGDALRLAVKLELSLDLFDDVISVCGSADGVVCEQVEEPAGNDPYAATRRAIVRAAQQILEISKGVM